MGGNFFSLINWSGKFADRLHTSYFNLHWHQFVTLSHYSFMFSLNTTFSPHGSYCNYGVLINSIRGDPGRNLSSCWALLFFDLAFTKARRAIRRTLCAGCKGWPRSVYSLLTVVFRQLK